MMQAKSPRCASLLWGGGGLVRKSLMDSSHDATHARHAAGFPWLRLRPVPDLRPLWLLVCLPATPACRCSNDPNQQSATSWRQ